jgi:myo-inositol-1(or 4)-monophosphatase
MSSHSYSDALQRIEAALRLARETLEPFRVGATRIEDGSSRAPSGAADVAVDAVLRRTLPRPGEGWISEEGADDQSKVHGGRAWAIDPLDGATEFIKGIPEFCISIGLLEDGVPVAGGILNPATGEVVVGAVDRGITYNGKSARPTTTTSLEGAVVLASRSEFQRGEWDPFKSAPFTIRPVGSVAYKLALIAAGRADATFTLTPKHVWDVAAGIALVNSAGGIVRPLGASPFSANGTSSLISGLLGSAPHIAAELSVFIDTHSPNRP